MIRTLIILFSLMTIAFNVNAKEDVSIKIEQQNRELEQKEELIKKETVRLQALKQEVEADIVKYTDLLKKIEKSLEEAETKGSQRLKHISKAYEAMQPEDAATRLTGLDDKTAVQILLKMNSKKAGLVIGMMEARKATILTKAIAKLKK